jgi:NodT family efflux transporter outer membrane factor (OMF) lipoprotein
MKNSRQSKRNLFFGFLILNSYLLLFLSGCNLAPAYDRPSVSTPPAFKETNGWKLAEPSDGVIKGKWWEMFNDPQLNALEEQVAISNQTIAGATQTFFAARALVQQARAAYYPTVTVDPAVTKSHSAITSSGSSGATNVIAGGGGGNYSIFTLPADASWEPDLWGTVRNTVRSDAYAAQASAATLENMRLTEQADLAVDYYELRGQDELIHLYNDTVKAYRDTLDLTTTLYKTGIDSELNEAQADSLLETTLAQSTALQIQRAQYEHAIAVLVGQPASTFSLKPTPLTNHPPQVPVGIPSTLLERRPDVATAERTVAAANATIGVTRAAFFPTLSLSASAGYENTSISSLISPPSFFWSVGANLAQTLFDAGLRRAANNQAWANYRAQVASYRETVLTAFQQVEDNLASLRVLSTEMQQQDVAVRASQKSFDLSLEQYRLGVASYLNVISSQETLLANQQTAVTLRMQQLVDTVQLIMTLGGGWNTGYLPSSGPLVLKSPPDAR